MPDIQSLHKLRQSRHVQLHNGPLARFNTWLALKITSSVGSMWCAYLFATIGIGSLVGVLTDNTVLALVCGAVSSYFLQLVLLPVIMVGQRVITATQDLQAESDHETLLALAAINDKQLRILELLATSRGLSAEEP